MSNFGFVLDLKVSYSGHPWMKYELLFHVAVNCLFLAYMSFNLKM
jgi:hypothetical protein